MTAELPGHDTCPKCGATVRPGAPWCTLCYADLRPKPEPDSEPAPELELPPYSASVVTGPDPLTAPLEAVAGEDPAPPVAGDEPTWPCSTCGTRNRMERDTCAGCGAPFLSGLRGSEPPLLELPVVGDITRLSRGQRFALAGGVVLAFVVLTLLIGLIFG